MTETSLNNYITSSLLLEKYDATQYKLCQITLRVFNIVFLTFNKAHYCGNTTCKTFQLNKCQC